MFSHCSFFNVAFVSNRNVNSLLLVVKISVCLMRCTHLMLHLSVFKYHLYQLSSFFSRFCIRIWVVQRICPIETTKSNSSFIQLKCTLNYNRNYVDTADRALLSGNISPFDTLEHIRLSLNTENNTRKRRKVALHCSSITSNLHRATFIETDISFRIEMLIWMIRNDIRLYLFIRSFHTISVTIT